MPTHDQPYPEEPTTSDTPSNKYLRGIVQTGDEMFPTPVANVEVELAENNGVTRKASTDAEGRFRFAVLIPDGTYELRLAGPYVGSTKVVWKGWMHDDIVIRARAR
jgi:hypothetical protein